MFLKKLKKKVPPMPINPNGAMSHHTNIIPRKFTQQKNVLDYFSKYEVTPAMPFNKS